jgi:hypothetical protein
LFSVHGKISNKVLPTEGLLTFDVEPSVARRYLFIYPLTLPKEENPNTKIALSENAEWEMEKK